MTDSTEPSADSTYLMSNVNITEAPVRGGVGNPRGLTEPPACPGSAPGRDSPVPTLAPGGHSLPGVGQVPMRLLSPHASRRTCWEAGDGYARGACSATRACLIDRAALSTIAVHDHMPYRCRSVCVCGSGAWLARSERSWRRCPAVSLLSIHHVNYM